MARRNLGLTEPWWVSKPHLLDEVRDEIEVAHPLLRVEIQDGVFVVGVLLIHVGSEIVGSYSVVIGFPPNYPDAMPWVFESGDRIPKTLDRHVFTGSGLACLMVPEEWQMAEDRSFRSFMEGPLRDYFLGQMIYEEVGRYPHGERKHGYEGLVEAYAEILCTKNNSAEVERWLKCLSRSELKGHFDCPCGAGRRLRDGCFETVSEIRGRVSPDLAGRMLARLKAVPE